MLMMTLFLACAPKLISQKTMQGLSIQNSKGTFSLSHKDIEKIHEKKGDFGCEWHLNLTENGKKVFADYTSKSVGTSLIFRVFDKKIMEPIIKEPILKGEVTINWGESCDVISYTELE